MPLCHLLKYAYERYRRPMIIGETSGLEEGRHHWLRDTVHEALAAVEIRRLKKAAGVEKLETFGEFWDFFRFTMATLTGDFMKYAFESKGMNHISVTWHRCFAYEGIKALGVIDRYECGIMYRVESWFDTLGIKYEVEPEVVHCMMHTEGRCYRDYTFFFEQ